MTIQRMMAIVASICALGACAHGGEAPDRSGTNRAGKTVAMNLCAGCHDISDEYRAPPPRTPGAPPAFITVASDPRLDVGHLKRFVRFPHGEMDNVVLTRREVDAVAAYIMSLKRP